VSTPDRQALDAELLAWMAERPWQPDESRFDRLARAVFSHQFSHCAPYQRFCLSRGVSPNELGDWRRIPAVPAGAFKEMPLRSFAAELTCKTFRTSGTSGAGPSGELHLDTLALYEASLMASLECLMFPDRGGSQSAAPMRVLAASPDESPDSSLSHMFGVLLAKHSAPASGFDVEADELQLDRLCAAIERAEATQEPITLLGTAFAFVHLLDALEALDRRFVCPAGSRIMETGGFKGRSRELSRSELYRALDARLGVPTSRIVNQYGMTELASQFYDSVLVDPSGPRRKLGPPWVRVRFVDPESGDDVAEGETGMIVIHDLANTGSIAAIETADLGRRVVSAGSVFDGLDGADRPDGFEVLGRHPDAEARGCSIAADVMLERAGRVTIGRHSG
jgi:hypothetical protein